MFIISQGKIIGNRNTNNMATANVFFSSAAMVFGFPLNSVNAYMACGGKQSFL